MAGRPRAASRRRRRRRPRSIGSISAGTSAGSYSRSASWITRCRRRRAGSPRGSPRPCRGSPGGARRARSRRAQLSTSSPVPSVEPSSTTTICLSRSSASTRSSTSTIVGASLYAGMRNETRTRARQSRQSISGAEYVLAMPTRAPIRTWRSRRARLPRSRRGAGLPRAGLDSVAARRRSRRGARSRAGLARAGATAARSDPRPCGGAAARLAARFTSRSTTAATRTRASSSAGRATVAPRRLSAVGVPARRGAAVRARGVARRRLDANCERARDDPLPGRARRVRLGDPRAVRAVARGVRRTLAGQRVLLGVQVRPRARRAARGRVSSSPGASAGRCRVSCSASGRS